jgi:hypothetical protein
MTSHISHRSHVSAAPTLVSRVTKISRVLDNQMKANQTKIKLKQMLKNIDKERTGQVKSELFF